MNKTKTKIAFGIGIVALLAVLSVSTASAYVTIYLDPQDSSVPEGYCHSTEVKVMANITGGDDLRAGQFNFRYDLPCCNVTDLAWGPSVFSGFSVWNPPGAPECWPPGQEHIRYYFMSPQTGISEICTLTIHCNSTEYCQTDLTFPYVGGVCKLQVLNESNDDLYKFGNATFVNGTFECGEVPPPETFSRGLVEGWNLISLPLTNDTDMTVANIMDTSLSGKYDALYKYDATTPSYVSLSSSDTMANGVGYFINMTSGDTWTYTGSAYTPMNVGLSQGLNMVGWLNCSKTIGTGSGDALYSIKDNYYYVAGWNATSQEFETYNPVAPPVFNDFTTMDRGEGYFISAKGVDTLSESC